jgi:hypothetical protein
MDKVKVVKGFYNKTSAKKEIASQNRFAKQNGLEIIKTDVVDSLHLYYSDPYFKAKIKKIGKPEAGKLVIVIYYKVSHSIITPAATQPTPVPATKVLKMPLKKTTIIPISADALLSKTKLIHLYATNNTIIIRPLNKTIPLPTTYHPPLAA